MSVLSLIQSACNNLGILTPSLVAGSSDPQVIQLLSLANTEGKLLAKRYDWQALRQEAVFTTVAAELQGALSTIAPGSRNIVNSTMWNRSLNRPVFGPLSAQDWQVWKSASLSGPYSEYRIMSGRVFFFPAPVAGQSIAFEAVTRNWCTDSTGLTGREAWLLDDDIGRLDEDLMLLGLIWRWRKSKGLDYSEDFTIYERQVATDFSRDGSKARLNLEGARQAFDPVVVVPAGSW